MICKRLYKLSVTCLIPSGGYSGINVTGGGGGGLTEPNILNPKKYLDLILCTQKNWTGDYNLFQSYFRILRELWLEWHKNY